MQIKCHVNTAHHPTRKELTKGCFSFARTSGRTPTNNDNHYEMSINPHDIEPEFQSDDERQNSDGGGNMEFVR